MKRTLRDWCRNGTATALCGFFVLGLAGCTGDEDVGGATEAKFNSPAEIAQESAADYNDNVNGLITANTLKGWIDNWSTNRPAGISGKLVILQTADGPEGYQYIKPNNTDVFTYTVGSSEWIETRSNGVIETRSMVPSGRSMDTFLAKYDIDPRKDMVVCAMGTGGAGQAMRMGRCWYMLRYWGAQKEHLAVLNGGNGWIGANTSLNSSYFSTAGSAISWSGSTSVADLKENNFALQATVEDLMNAVPTQDENLLGDGIFVWDARSDIEYSPTEFPTHFRNGGSTQGHPNSALLLPYSTLLDANAGYTFKSKDQLQAYLNGYTDAEGNGFIDNTMQPVGYGRAYQPGDTIYTYCETTFRAMITGIASTVVLGLPTRFYDGAMVEWHSLSNVVASDGNPILPADSPWRTDLSSYSNFMVAADPAEVDPRSITNAYAASANAIINADKAYKGIAVSGGTTADAGTAATGGSSSGGSSIPANPCGG
jgi:3-mercaptopyruvate sulfurtransferase SseA